MPGKPFNFAVIDAFTSVPFAGNPAGVLILERGHGLSDEQFQLIATEFNLSETAFVEPLEDHSPEKPHYSLRWFTPATEVELCGHATVASAYVLFNTPSAPLKSSLIRFASKFKGELTAGGSPGGTTIELNFPDAKPEEGGTQPEIEKCFEGGRLEGKVKGWGRKGRWTIVEVDKSVNIQTLVPKHTTLAAVFADQNLILTSAAPSSSSHQDNEQVHSRVFAPQVGIPEDPVTGSAHCVIGPWWLSSPDRASSVGSGGKKVVRCKQVSKRGGKLEVEWKEEEGRVLIRGEAVKVTEGTIWV